jgi:hypothetical protein
MKKLVVMLFGMLALGISAHAQTLLNSWENSQEGWTILEPNWTTTAFSTNTGVTAGTYSWELTAASSPDYGAALQGPSSTALTTLMADASQITLDVLAPTAGSFGYYLQWDLVVSQPGGLGNVSSDGFTYSQSPSIGGPESHLTFTIPAAIRTALAANPTLPASLIFQIGGGGGGTIYIDNLRVWEVPTYAESWENTQDGWTILEPNWTSDGFSTNIGVTAGTYSWELTAASSPDYGAALQSPSSTALTAAMSSPGSIDLDVLAPTAGSFGYYLQWDLVVSQPGGLGNVSSDGYTYSQSPSIGGPESHFVFTIPSAITTGLAANPTLPTSLIFQIGGGGGGTVYLDNLLFTPNGPPSAGAAQLWVRETFDDHGPKEVYPAVTPYYDDVSSVGFNAGEPWVVNPAPNAQTNDLLMAIRGYPDFSFPVGPDTMGLPSSLDGDSGAVVEDNSFNGKAGGSLWTDGDFMTRALAPNNFINFSAEGEYWFAMTIGQKFDAQYSGDIPASGAGGIGFADGDDTNADFLAIGVTGTNVYLGPADAGDPYGTTNVTKSVYISQGTLGQPGDPNSLIYNPINDPAWGPNYNLTNFTGGPYYVSAYGTNAYGAARLGVVQGDGIVVLGHLRTHASGPATLDAKTYIAALDDQMDLPTNGFSETNIQWDCSYSFNFTGTMTRMLVFENGEFPFYIYAFRASTNLASVLGIDPGYIAVAPLTNTFVGFPINMTNFAAEANFNSSTVLSGNGSYGTLNYQWYQNGELITNATSQFLNIPAAATNDPSMPAGTDAGAYISVATDAAGFWGSVTTAPVVITVEKLNPVVVTGVQLFANQSTINVSFSEPNLTGDAVLANYSLSDGVTITNVVELPANGVSTTVQLQTTPQPIGTKLTLTINDVTNAAGGVLSTATESFWTDIPGPDAVDIDFWAYPSQNTQYYFNTFLPANPNPEIMASYTDTSWDGPGSGVNVNGGNYFGGRMYGWFIPPITTNYVFYMACDDGGRLSLSTNSDPTNLCVIAAETLWSDGDSWTNYSYEFPTGDHRGDGTSTTANAAGTVGWDTSAAAGATNGGVFVPNPATACQQNRSDQFIVAYYDSSGLPGGPAGADDQANWANLVTAGLSEVTDAVLPGSRFWPNVDANGQALISLTAGQKYYIQLEHVNQTGGYAESVTYKYAGAPDPLSPTASIMSGSNIEALVAFTPSLSITQSNGSPVINYYGVLLSGTTVTNINTQVGVSSGGAGQYIPPPGQAAEFFRASE